MFGKVVEFEGRERDGPFLIVCEHASCRLPEQLSNLGLASEHLESHIAWDIGASGVASGLARRLGGPLVSGAISRLVYDLNRPPEAHDSIPARSEDIIIPGNSNLSKAERAQRVNHIYRPFEAALEGAIRQRAVLEALVTVHSFTPVWLGEPRDVEIGILCGRDARLAERVLDIAQASAPDRNIRLNEPYGPEDGVAHTLDRHGAANSLPSVMIEIRNDLISEEEEREALAEELAGWVQAATASLNEGRAQWQA